MSQIFRNSVILFAALLFIAGCSGPLRGTWVNFTSYYNTFYNAKQSFERGEKAIIAQTVLINPERPIRIHRTPLRAGRTDFEEAIERSADVLIRFPTSKHVDEAIALIGKSYYYLANYFAAEQKFNELFDNTTSSHWQREAVIWRGRVMLELGRFSEAINYLENQLTIEELNWNNTGEAEVNLLIAQHLIQLGSIDESEPYLARGLSLNPPRELRSRAHFLYAQVLMSQGRIDDAYRAFNRVRRTNPEYQYIYHAERLKGVTMRESGNYEHAMRIFQAMSRDDKNFENFSEINYEIARITHMTGKNREALQMYRDVIHASRRPPARETVAKSHYGIANLYRNVFLDYNLAAAHYDSASRNASDLMRLPERFDARDLAISFGEFARLKNETSRLDSLLWLGSLSVAELDSVVNVVRERKIRELRESMRQAEADAGTIVNVGAGTDEIFDTEFSTEMGFLGHRNPSIVAQGIQEFQAIWQGRPLVDNWRRIEAVRRAGTVAVSGQNGTGSRQVRQQSDPLAQQVNIDLSVIPRTPQEKQRMKQQLATAEYEIGNVYFLSLNMPDSAKPYFQRVAETYRETEIAPQALYSLSELYSAEGDSFLARRWANVIVSSYPQTVFAERLADRYSILSSVPLGLRTPGEQFEREYGELVEDLNRRDPLELAEDFRRFANTDTVTTLAPEALFRAANLYMEVAGTDPEFISDYNRLASARSEFEQKREELTALRDSAGVVLADTALGEQQKEYWTSIQDSSMADPDFSDLFPYNNAAWDSARVILAEIPARFPAFEKNNRVNTLLNEIRLPDGTIEEAPKEIVPIADGVYSCEDLGAEPELQGGVRSFLIVSGINNILYENEISTATFRYKLTIGPEGRIRNIQMLDEPDEFGVNEVVMNIVRNQATFEPISYDGERVVAVCEFNLVVTLEEQ
ncbi:MAG: tetratricopeptide repeat protein [Rhodothermaceae bacterium]|nr:tetratricopeptide repeat protein [Rhodothermaceae bacterium]